jgi:hypothetical protein
MTGLIHVLTRGQAEICDRVNPCVDIFLPVSFSTHGLTLSYISACPLVNTWINPVTYFCLSPCQHMKYVTGLIQVLTRGQAEIFDWVNPCVDKGTGRNM